MSIILALFSNWRVAAAGAAVVALLATHGVAYWRGYSAASDKCQTAALKAENKALKKTAQDTQEALEDATRRALTRANEVNTLNQKVEDYADQLENRVDCNLSDADARWLSEIR